MNILKDFYRKIFFREDKIEQKAWIYLILGMPLFASAAVVAITYSMEIAFLIFILAVFIVLPNGYRKKLIEDFSISQKQVLYHVLLIILLASFLRIYNLDTESLWLDEALSIEQYAENDVSIIISRLTVHPPLYYITLHFWIKLFGDSEFSARFLSTILGIISIYVIYRLGKLIFSDEVGILSAFILSISLFHVAYSQEIRFYSLLTLLTILSNYYFIKILKERNFKNTIGYVISTAAMCYTHIFGTFYLMFQNIFYILIFRKKLKYWIMVQTVIFLFLVPWIPKLLVRVSKIASKGIWIPQPTLITIYNTFVAFAGSEIILFFFIIVIIIGLNISKFYKLGELNNRIFVLFWLFIPILVSIVISLITTPIYMSKYVIGSLPAFCILIAKSITNFRKKFVIIGIVLVIIFLSIYPFQRYYYVQEKEQWRELADYIDRNEGKNDITLLQGPHPALQYYSEKTGMTTGYIEIWNEKKVKNIIKDKRGVWLIVSHGNESISNLIKNEINKTHILQYDMLWQFKGIHVWYYLTKNYKIDQIQKNQPNIIPISGYNRNVAQSFIPKVEYLDAIELKFHKDVGLIRISVRVDHNNVPNDEELGSVTIEPLPYNTFVVEFGHIKLEPNNKYWIVIERTTNNDISFVGEGGGNTDSLMVYDINTHGWKNFYWGNRSGNGLYFKTMYLEKLK